MLINDWKTILVFLPPDFVLRLFSLFLIKEKEKKKKKKNGELGEQKKKLIN